MEDLLRQLQWKDKEIRCYLALLELGQQPSSVLSKRLKIPKATILFVLHHLTEKGYIRMNKRGKTEYFHADPKDLERLKNQEIILQNKALNNLIPLLEEFKNPLSSPPHLSFFEGVEACKNAYAQLLESSTDILEFATHEDLAEKFGEEWMDEFIKQRSLNKVFIKSICHDSPWDRKLQPLDKKHRRSTKFIPQKKGKMYSCMTIYEDKLLLLNLSSDAFGILIENAAIVETMKTIHRIAWNSRSLR